MQEQRISGLADGIFAITMTLLLLELKVPSISVVNDAAIWQSLIPLYHIFISLMLSFALLFTYWRAQHFLVSIYAKQVTVGLANWNALFFFLILVVPFTTSLLGNYPHNHAAIIIYGTNVILIGLALFGMRRYIEEHPKIDTLELHIDEQISGYVRILFPVTTALLAILVSFWSPTISIILFALGILFNLVPASTNIIHKVIVEAVKESD